eukprot:gene26853-4456_t
MRLGLPQAGAASSRRSKPTCGALNASAIDNCDGIKRISGARRSPIDKADVNKRVNSITSVGADEIDIMISKREFIAASAATAAGMSMAWFPAEAKAEETVAAVADKNVGSTPYVNTKQKYSMAVPSEWEKIDKMGADVLFEDPSRRSSSLGVTVNPVKIKSIRDFGSVEEIKSIRYFGSMEEVGEKLLNAERNKSIRYLGSMDEDEVGEKLLNAEKMKSAPVLVFDLAFSGPLDGATPAELFDYEYELDSTRGLKRIINTVTIYGGQLYILNGAYKCEKTGCDTSEQLAVVQRLQDAAKSFRIAKAVASL